MEELINSQEDKTLRAIGEKVLSGKRISPQEALELFKSKDLGYICALAEHINKQKNSSFAYFVLNMQINPTNICIYSCSFCAFGVKKSDPKSYELSEEEILNKVSFAKSLGIREIHMVGGIPPHWEYNHYINLTKAIKQHSPEIILKAWTAVEIHHMSKISSKSHKEILKELKDAGLDALPGGGAEIFSQRVREIIAPFKAGKDEYLDIHESAHRLGIPSNATMLYGHVETYEERVQHLKAIRDLQDKTDGFQVFIPLAYWPEGTNLGGRRTSSVDDIKTIAISRIFLDNFNHIKAYWVTLGERVAQVALNCGADDLDGTILEEKIVHSAGTTSPISQSKEKLIELIKGAGKIPVERDTFYRPICIH
ncbi:MAG: aminofutalosine synthase MqnE [Aquificaceae bacterium]